MKPKLNKDFIKWLRENAMTTYTHHNNVNDYYWCLREEIRVVAEAHLKNEPPIPLPYYTDDQIFEIYKTTVK